MTSPKELAMAYGAALDPERAVIGCLGEAVERYSGCHPDLRKVRIAAWKDFKEEALHPDQIAGYCKSQYRQLSKWVAPFTEKIKVGWVKGKYVNSGQPVWVPSQCVYLGRIPGETIVLERGSTGLAAGSSMEQAILHGLLEVVEHDAFTIAWLNRLSPPIVELEKHSYLQSVFQEQLARPHLNYKIVDITTDLGIPSYVVIIRQKSGWPCLRTATCTRLDAPEAIIKAAIEGLVSRTIILYQRSYYENVTKGKSVTQVFKETAQDNHGDTYADPRFFRYAEFLGSSKRRIQERELPNYSQKDTKKDLAFCLAKLKSKGFEPIVVDITPNEVRRYGLKAVKVIVPGLQPLHFGLHFARLKNRRLYEAPVAMGYKKRPTTMKEIYRIPHPLM